MFMNCKTFVWDYEEPGEGFPDYYHIYSVNCIDCSSFTIDIPLTDNNTKLIKEVVLKMNDLVNNCDKYKT